MSWTRCWRSSRGWRGWRSASVALLLLACSGGGGASPSSSDEAVFAVRERGELRGGCLTTTLDAPAERVVAALLEHDEADGHRAWAREQRTLERDGDRLLVEWRFRGRMGIAPEVVLELRRRRERLATVIDFELARAAFGLAVFEGSWRVTPLPDGRARLEATVFIDSGLPYVNASLEDVERGLREDARLLAEWVKE